MSETKTLKRNFKTKIIQITYKIRKEKDVYNKVLQEVIHKLRKVLKVLKEVIHKLRKVLKVLKMIRKVLKSVRKSPVENRHHAETSQSTRNTNKLARYNTTRAQKQKRFQKIPEHQ